MALTAAEFLAALAGDRKKLADREAVVGVAVCPDCSVPLQESVTGSRKTSRGYLCSDCYYDKMGDEIDAYPIAMPRVIRGK